MRNKLSSHNGQRLRFYATVGRYGDIGGETSLCVHDVRASKHGKILVGHVWMLWPGAREHRFRRGDKIVFEGTVYQYAKRRFTNRGYFIKRKSQETYGIEDPKLVAKEKK